MTAIRAMFASYRPLPSRNVGLLTFEVPLEALDAAVAALGGTPLPSRSVWTGIAPLAPTAPAAGAAIREDAGATPSLDPPAAGPSPAERYASKGEGQKAVVRAALLCDDVKFQRWLRDQYPVVWTDGLARGDTAPDMTAAYVLRRACFIESRGELATNDNALVRFADIETAFKTARDYSPNLTGRK